MAREIFDAFYAADEVSDVRDSFEKLLEHAELDYETNSRDFVDRLQKVYEGKVAFSKKKIFGILKDALAKKQDEWTPDNVNTRVFVSGAGPCGLRSAVEAALLGFKATIVEKRGTFSRANILMLWTDTKDDLVSNGSKYFYKDMKTQGSPLHLGTREIQLAFLKTALLLGVRVYYETEMKGVLFDDKQQMWCAQIKSVEPPKEKVDNGIKHEALDFKPLKLGDYKATFKCNMIDDSELDPDFITKRIDGATLVPFHSCIIAEGEWSKSLQKLGFKKSIDKFNQALGLVINLKYNKKNKEEVKLQSFSQSKLVAKAPMLKKLDAAGVDCQNIEYLKGRTHYIAVTISKEVLLSSGTLKKDLPVADLLSGENLDMNNLRALGKKISGIIGLPAEVEFYPKNAVQIFDFSSRARARRSVKYLTTESTTGAPTVINDLGEDAKTLSGKPLADRAHIAPVYPVGDALLEPFWPQGLGTNRGFHGCIDAVYSTWVLQKKGLEDAHMERDMAYSAMLALTWGQPKYVINPYTYWGTDYISRYSPLSLKTAVGMVQHAGNPIPSRFENNACILEMQQILKLPQQIYQ